LVLAEAELILELDIAKGLAEDLLCQVEAYKGVQ
jgi:hypothetical protein